MSFQKAYKPDEYKSLIENNFSEKIDNIDLTDPNKPKIKVFKP